MPERTPNPYPSGSGMRLNTGRMTMQYALHRSWAEGYAAAKADHEAWLASDEAAERVARALHVYEHGDTTDYAPPDYAHAARAVLAALRGGGDA